MSNTAKPELGQKPEGKVAAIIGFIIWMIVTLLTNFAALLVFISGGGWLSGAVAAFGFLALAAFFVNVRKNDAKTDTVPHPKGVRAVEDVMRWQLAISGLLGVLGFGAIISARAPDNATSSATNIEVLDIMGPNIGYAWAFILAWTIGAGAGWILSRRWSTEIKELEEAQKQAAFASAIGAAVAAELNRPEVADTIDTQPRGLRSLLRWIAGRNTCRCECRTARATDGRAPGLQSDSVSTTS